MRAVLNPSSDHENKIRTDAFPRLNQDHVLASEVDMGRTRKLIALPGSLPAAVRKLFTLFPTGIGCNEPEYRKRLADVFSAVQPTDSIEAFWAKDLLDLTLEIERLRQIEAGLLESQAREADRTNDIMHRHVAKVSANLAMVRWSESRGLDHRSETPEMKEQWAKYYEEELSLRLQHPAPTNHSADQNDMAQSFLRQGAELDQVSRMIALAEGRRRSVLRELERYRATVRRAPAGKENIVDAEFSESVEPR